MAVKMVGCWLGRGGFPWSPRWPVGPCLLSRGEEFEVHAKLARKAPWREDHAKALVSRRGQREVKETPHLGPRLDRSLRERLGDDVSRIRPIASEDGPQPYPIAG